MIKLSYFDMPYDAFISYAHAADSRIAPLVQRALTRLAKPWYKVRSLSVFRDTTSLAAANDLTASIRAAIAGSRYFVYLASPEAAASRWVGAELAAWKERDLPQRLLIVQTAGEIAWNVEGGDFDWAISTALHPNLKFLFHSEPLWVDLRWAKSVPTLSPRDPRLQQAMAMLAAPMHGKSMEAIIGDEVQQQRRTIRWIASVAGVLLLLLFLFVGASIVAFGVNDHLDIANKNLTSKLDLVNMAFPFFDLETVEKSDDLSAIDDESRANDAAPRPETFATKLTRIWDAYNSKDDSATLAETWVKWGPERLALASDCDAQKTLYAYNPKIARDCPPDASLFNPDGLRTDISGLVNIVDALAQAQINGKLGMLAREMDRISAQFDSGLAEPVEETGANDSSDEVAASLYTDIFDIILPPRLSGATDPHSKAKKPERKLELGQSFQMWRQPLAASGTDAELIFIQLNGGLCGSGGCDKTVLGFLRLAQRYELVYNATSSGILALYETGHGNMPQIFAIAQHQSGHDQQYVEVRRSVFDQQCLCYTPYLAGRAISFKQQIVNQAIPAN